MFWLLGQQRRCAEICNALLHENTTWKLTFVVATFEGGKAVEVIQCVFREKAYTKRGTDKQTNDEMPQEIGGNRYMLSKLPVNGHFSSESAKYGNNY